MEQEGEGEREGEVGRRSKEGGRERSKEGEREARREGEKREGGSEGGRGE